MAQSNFYGWKMLAAMWAILFVNIAFPMYGAGVINTYMVDELQLDRTTLGSIFSLFVLMSGLPGPLVAAAVNRYGPRLTLIAGGAIVACGAVLMATVVSSGFQAIVIFGGVIGFGVSAGGVLAAQTAAAFWFARQRARALAILHSAAAIGGFIAAPLLNFVIARSDNDWRIGWWLITALAIGSTAIAAFFIVDRPERIDQLPDGDIKTEAATPGMAPGGDDWRLGEALRTRAFWQIMLCTLGMGGGFALFTAHGVIHMRDLGHSAATAAFALSLMPFGDLLGKIVVMAGGGRVDPRYLWAGLLVVFAAGLLLAVDGQAPMQMYVATLCLGAGFGGGIVLLMTLLGAYYGAAAFASVAGIALALQTIVSSTVPLIGGRVYDQVHSYSNVFHPLAALTLLGAVLLVVLRAPRRGG